MSAHVEWNGQSIRELFLSEEVADALMAEGRKKAAEIDAHINAAAHSEFSMDIAKPEIKRLRNTCVCRVGVRSFRKGAKRGGRGPQAVAGKHGMI